MPPAALIDTGAILAIVEVDDAFHSACLASLASLRMPLLTTEAVLTELFHLTRHTHIQAAWRFVRSGAMTVQRMDDSDLPALHGLMTQY